MNVFNMFSFNQLAWYFSNLNRLTVFFVFGYGAIVMVQHISDPSIPTSIVAALLIAFSGWFAIDSFRDIRLKYKQEKK